MNQPQSLEALAAASAANVDVIRSVAFTSLKATERLMSLNLDFARASLRLGADCARPASGTDWRHVSSGLQKTAEETATYLRSVYDISAEAQAEVNEVITSRVDDLSDSINSLLDVVAKSAPGSDKAVNMIRTAFANGYSAYAQMAKSAPQAGGNGSRKPRRGQ